MNEEHNDGRGGKVKRNTGRAWPRGGWEEVKTMQTREQQLQRLRPDENSTWTIHALSLSRVIACRSHFLGRCCPPPTVPFIPFGLSLSTSRRPVLFHHRPALRSSDISSEKLNLRLTANFLRLFRPSQIDAAPPPTFFPAREPRDELFF